MCSPQIYVNESLAERFSLSLPQTLSLLLGVTQFTVTNLSYLLHTLRRGLFFL